MNALKPDVDATPVILVEDLTHRFGEFVAVDHIRYWFSLIMLQAIDLVLVQSDYAPGY
jgi:hypothetical protein